MLRKNKRLRLHDAFFLAVLLFSASVIAYLFFFSPDLHARASGAVIREALQCYERKHHGIYPEPKDIIGGDAPKDALIKSGCLKRYPVNEYAGGRRMRNSPMDSFTPGDFQYKRIDNKAYHFSLTVFGKTERSGINGDGIVFIFVED